MSSLLETADRLPWIKEILSDLTVGHRTAAETITAKGVPTSRSAVQRARWRLAEHSESAEPAFTSRGVGAPHEEVNKGEAVTDESGGSLKVTLDKPIENDWSHVFALFGLDPDGFEIIDDTVRCSTWQQSKGLDDGSRSTVQLYSYSCRFRKVIPTKELDLASIEERIWKFSAGNIEQGRTTHIRPEIPESTFVVCWADLQLGKAEGGGVSATVDRFMDALDATVKRLVELREAGRNITHICVLNMGDPIEGCDQNYAQQTFTVELNLRDQLTLALNVFALGLTTLAEYADKITFGSVLCNHGEWNRKSGKSYTDDADNAGGFIADTLRTIFSGRPDAEKFHWIIPRDEMIITLNLSGTEVAATHGHVMPQSSDNIKGENAWLTNQSLGLLRRNGTEPRLWVTAHRHHAMVLDFGPWWRIQCSALDGGSKWFTDQSGKWASYGVTTFLAGNHDMRGFSDYLIL